VASQSCLQLCFLNGHSRMLKRFRYRFDIERRDRILRRGFILNISLNNFDRCQARFTRRFLFATIRQFGLLFDEFKGFLIHNLVGKDSSCIKVGFVCYLIELLFG
jgi:hypothetical protein